MHECPNCGMACDCDGEDTWLEAPDNCSCECEEFDDEGYPEYDDDLEDICPHCNGTTLSHYDDSVSCPHCVGGVVRQPR